MALEDFFTITELKDGLRTPTRVSDLVNVMQNQNENNVKNESEETRQWSAVANTIAATENKECLDLFIQLDGLRFIDRWLRDAQKLVNDTGDGSLEELAIVLLRALERLQVDRHQSVGSGIGLTVQSLVGHSSLVVREKAKHLCDRWAPVQNINGPPTDVNSVDVPPLESINTVQQETDKEEIVRQEVIMKSGTEVIKVENNKFKSESGHLTETCSPLEDAKENLEVDSLTTLSSPLEHKALTSTTDVDHPMESVTRTETIEDKSDKDEVNTVSGDAGLQELPGDENLKSSSNSESDEEDEKKEVRMESDDDSESRSPLSKPLIKSQNDDLISKRPSDMELDYGMVDPLELARQVAIEVELEVDSQEQSCSTSTNVNEHESTGGLGHEVSSGPGPGSGSSPPSAPEPRNDLETIDKPVLNSEKGFSGFDLNQEVSFDEIEMGRLEDPRLTPISVVSASRATAAANGPPFAPLQFEGTLGWKGSASTSAFRRIPEGERTVSSSSSHSNSNQLLNRFEFDLNVSEAGVDTIQGFVSQDKIEDPSRLQLDLNSLGDSDASIITLDWKRDSRVASMRQNRAQSPSVSSSMQPSFTNIDLNLNDQLTVQNTASFNNPFLGKLFNNKRDESVISIFGTQVEVNRKDSIPPLQHNGRILEPSVDFNLGRPGSGLGLGSSLPYSNLPAYGYNHNGFTMGPMYGPPGAPIPYMVDSRGAPIIPPIPPAFSQPFFFNMAATGTPSGSNDAGPSLNVNTLDLNSGFITERGNRENNNGGLRQFFNHNQASSSSVIGGKREQPDSGWELFPTNYKHQQPPWQ